MYLATGSDYLKKLAGTLPVASVSDLELGWFRQNTNPTAGQKNVFMQEANAVSSPTTYWGLVAEGTAGVDRLRNQFNTTGITHAPIAAGAWRHYAIKRGAGVSGLWLGGDFVAQFSDGSSYSTTVELLGGDGAGIGDLDIVYVREFSGLPSLSAGAIRDIIIAEMLSTTPVRTTNLFADYPLIANANDAFGTNHWTSIGSPTFPGDYPAFFDLTNLTSGTAIDITADVPGIYSASIPPLPVGLELWYKFTVGAADQYLSFFAKGTTALAAPLMDLQFLDSTLVEFQEGNMRPVYQKFGAGETWYVRLTVRAAGMSYTAQTLTIESQTVQNGLPVPVGTILINDDGTVTGTADLVGFDATTGDVVALIDGFVKGESGDALATGESIWTDDDGATEDTVAFDKNLVEVARTNYGAPAGNVWNIRRQGTVFYILHRDKKIRKVDATLTSLEIRTHTYSTSRMGIAVSPDLSIAYLQIGDNIANEIKRWNLTADSALSDLVAAVSGYKSAFDLLTLSDGSVLAGYFKVGGGSNSFVRRYDAAGATVQSYDLGADDEVNHLTYDPGTTSFWVWTYPTNDQTSRVIQIRASDGVFLKDFTTPLFSGGTNSAAISDTPAFFGSQACCPFVVQQVDTDAPEEVPVDENNEEPVPGGTSTASSCCDSHTTPLGGETPVVPNPVGPLPPWETSCIGRGQVDSVANLGPVEVW